MANSFKKTYSWALDAKLYMGVYFAAYLFVYGIVAAVMGEFSIRSIFILEMLLLGMAVGFLQKAIVPSDMDFAEGVFTKGSIIWLAAAELLTIFATIFCGWFSELSVWGAVILCVFSLGGYVAMLFGIKFQQDLDSKFLNRDLARYKANSEE